MKSLQGTYGPNLICFGCRPANPNGLQLKGFPQGDECVAEYRVQKHHEAFPRVVNGGIIGALFDCHSNWTATWALMRKSGARTPPCTVTADFYVVLKRPTPSDAVLHLRPHPSELGDDGAIIQATLEANECLRHLHGNVRGGEGGTPRLPPLVAEAPERRARSARSATVPFWCAVAVAQSVSGRPTCTMPK